MPLQAHTTVPVPQRASLRVISLMNLPCTVPMPPAPSAPLKRLHLRHTPKAVGCHMSSQMMVSKCFTVGCTVLALTVHIPALPAPTLLMDIVLPPPLPTCKMAKTPSRPADTVTTLNARTPRHEGEGSQPIQRKPVN